VNARTDPRQAAHIYTNEPRQMFFRSSRAELERQNPHGLNTGFPAAALIDRRKHQTSIILRNEPLMEAHHSAHGDRHRGICRDRAALDGAARSASGSHRSLSAKAADLRFRFDRGAAVAAVQPPCDPRSGD